MASINSVEAGQFRNYLKLLSQAVPTLGFAVWKSRPQVRLYLLKCDCFHFCNRRKCAALKESNGSTEQVNRSVG